MKTAFKVVILFLFVFMWRVPIVYNTAVLAVILTLLYYFLKRGSIPVAQFNSRYPVTILLITVAYCFVYMMIILLHQTYYENLMYKRLVLQLFMMYGIFLAFPLFIEGHEDHAFEEMAKIVAITFAVQGAIHLTGFIYTPFGEMIAKITGNYENYLQYWNMNIKYYRYFALCGSVFFELPCVYGVASIIVFRLLLIQGQRYLSGYWPIIILFFIFSGICLSGRTGFVGFSMGVLLYAIFVSKNFPDWNKNLLRWFNFAALMLIIYFLVLPPTKRKSFSDDLFPFAFEAFYNYQKYGEFKTGSTEYTMEAHYYPLRSETWLKGHGTQPYLVPGYFFTDAGYMYVIIFGGVFFLLFLSIFQYMFFAEPIAIANARGTPEGKHDFYCFVFILILMFIHEYKGAALGTIHYVSVLMSATAYSYIIRHKYRLEHGLY